MATEPETMTPQQQRMVAFDETIRRMNKEFKSELGDVIGKLSDRPMNVEKISSGSITLDSISGGGLPKGRIIEIYGPEASGKTSIALTAVADVQRKGGTAVLIDLENAFDPRYARKLGVNIEDLAVSQPDNAEQALELVYRLSQSGVVDIIVVDSVAAMSPKAEIEADMEKQSIGLLARLMSKALRKLVKTVNSSNTCLIFINQTRESMSMYGPSESTPGGKALKFYASMRIRVAKESKPVEGEDKKPIGVRTKLKIVKNKVAPPFGEGATVLTFNKGINTAAELIEEAPKYGVIQKPSTVTYVEAATGEKIGEGAGKQKAIDGLNANPAMMERISKALAEAIERKLFAEPDADDEPAKDEPDEELTAEALFEAVNEGEE